MTSVDARPNFQQARQLLDHTGLNIIGETETPSGSHWEELRFVYVAPEPGIYSVDRLRSLHSDLVEGGFEAFGPVYAHGSLLNIGQVHLDMGDRRMIVQISPDRQMAEERFEWQRAWNQGTGQELREKYAAQGKKEPFDSYFSLRDLRVRSFLQVLDRIGSNMPFYPPYPHY